MNIKTLINKWGKRVIWFLMAKDERVGNVFYALQRALYGYSENDAYSIDWWLSEVMPPAIDELISKQNGCPGEFLETFDPTEEELDIGIKKWEAVMREIRDGFVAWRYLQEHKWSLSQEQKEPYKKKFRKGMELMTIYFHTMWW